MARSLHQMLGLSDAAGPADIRHAYEAAMRVATRSSDHRRALELSTAYDALDARTRRQIFPAARSGPGSARGEHTASVHPGDFDLGPMPARGAGRRRDGRGRRFPIRHSERAANWGRRLLAGLVGIGLAVLIGSYLWRIEYPRQPAYPRPRPVPSQNQPADQVAQRIELKVPDRAPVDANGLVTIRCPGGDGQVAQEFKARPGDLVSCDNGTVPQLGP